MENFNFTAEDTIADIAREAGMERYEILSFLDLTEATSDDATIADLGFTPEEMVEIMQAGADLDQA